MEAFAKNVTSDMESIESTDKDKTNGLSSNASLFSTDEIIFPDENTERAYTRYGYQISYMSFLVPEGTVCEVIQNPRIFSLPNAPSWIEGLLNIRGNIIPVMNVGKYLKHGNKEKFSNILVLDKSDNENAIAVMISNLPTSLEINDSKTSTSSSPDALLEFIDAGFKQNGINWIEFDPQKLFKKLAEKSNT